MDIVSIFSLWTDGLVVGILLSALPWVLGVLINFAFRLMKK